MDGFLDYFGDVPDPRAANARHEFGEVLFIALSALLCGAQGCCDMADFARAKQGLLGTVLKLPHGPPSHDTFSRLFRHLDPQAFEAAFARFTRAFARAHAKPLEGVVALDGKALRGAYLRGRKATPLHLVNVWAAEARLTLGQRLAPGRNEVAGVLEALALLDLDGCTVTADALHCRVDTAAAILARGGDYALALKANQPRLLAAAEALLDAGQGADHAVEGPTRAHDRLETRVATVVPAPALARTHGFPGLVAIARVESRRRADDAPHVRVFALSRRMGAAEALRVARTHWHIENRLHWQLDVALDEDRCRSRKDHGPQNLALLRKLALNLLQTHPQKASIPRKIKRAAWDEAFLTELLAQMR